MELDSSVVATFAKHMVCPPSLIEAGRDNSKVDISTLGKNDYDRYPFRHSREHFHGTNDPHHDKLIEKIVEAISQDIRGDKVPLLLLSDGKDSMSLAVSLHEMGVRCETLTLLRREDYQLKEYIENVSQSLGHIPHFITVDEALRQFDASEFVDSCRKMELPVLDQAYLFFFLGLKSFFITSGKDPAGYQVIDGLGNDEHLGYLPSKQQLRSYQLSRLGLWKVWKRSNAVRWYIRSPAESHGDLSSLACFYSFPRALDLNEYFSSIPHSSEPLSFVDFRAFSRGSFHDHQCMMGKTLAASKFLGADVAFPWKNKILSDYCFNLPLNEKFCFERLENKLILRKLLRESIGWKQEKRGVDLYFDLDASLFKKDIASQLVPDKILSKIEASKFLPSYVKSRAYLEVVNLYGYCTSRGYSDDDVVELFGV